MKNIGNVKKDGQVRAVASGALTDGTPVIVNSDGTVSVVSGSNVSENIGTDTVFESGNTINITGAYDANAQKVVIIYQDSDNSMYGTAVVGTTSGNTISFGTPVVFESAQTSNISADYDSNAQKIVIAYTDQGNSSRGTSIVGTVSGTSISFGTAVVHNSTGTTIWNSIAYDANAQKVVVAYEDYFASRYGTAIVGTVSGTSISFGSETVFESAHANHISITYDSNAQKVVIAYRDNGNSNYGTAIVGTVSGTSISFGTAVVFNSGSTERPSIVYDSTNNKVVIAYRDVGNSSYGTAIVGTVSGTSISFGSEDVFESANVNYISAAYDANAQKVVVAYTDNGNTEYGTVAVGTVSGTSISFTTPSVLESATSNYFKAIYDSSNNKVVIAYRDEGNTDKGTARVFQAAYGSTNITSENFIGFSDGAFADTQSAAINTANTIDRNQSSLTAGQTYFVQTDGTLGLTADDPSVTAGTAISATELIVKG